MTNQQKAEAVERALAGEAQCIYCRKWKPHNALRFTTRLRPYCPGGEDIECDRTYDSLSRQEKERRWAV